MESLVPSVGPEMALGRHGLGQHFHLVESTHHDAPRDTRSFVLLAVLIVKWVYGHLKEDKSLWRW